MGNTEETDSIVPHLVEMRDRLLRCLAAFVIAFAVLCAYPGSAAIYDALASPMISAMPHGSKMIAIGVLSPFMVPLKVTAFAAFLLALPYVLFQAWGFFAPALFETERRIALPLVVSSVLLFLAGMAFCHFAVFGQVFRFLVEFAPEGVQASPDIESHLSFVTSMFLAFGVAFEVPVAVVALAKIGIVTVERLKEWRGYFIVAAFVVAAVLTPPDVVSQLSLAIPMCLLYELGILVAKLVVSSGSSIDDSQGETECGRM